MSRRRRQAEFFGYRTELAPPKPIERSRNELERRFLRLCQRHHLPSPEVNAPLLGYEADFLWRDAKLIVETDGYDSHSGRESIEYDRRREAEPRRRGLRGPALHLAPGPGPPERSRGGTPRPADLRPTQPGLVCGYSSRGVMRKIETTSACLASGWTT